MPSPRSDLLPKIVLAVINSVALGEVALLAGYWLNRRLERHKRNEAIHRGGGEQGVAAYLAVLAITADINGYMMFSEFAAQQEEPE